MTGVQCSYAELLGLPGPVATTRDEFELLDEDEALALVTRRYRRYLRLGIDWEHALLLAVDLDVAA
jgi:hypothetical protein